MTKDLPRAREILDSLPLLNLGDSVTTDHISPAGSIARNSAAARYLASRHISPRELIPTDPDGGMMILWPEGPLLIFDS
ncbi:IRP1A [Caligus rogercresseyi]|uniref:IRP1A n=1 Tax=Caligus rogercresseyi TaxID=217165 RepID=A0A7T8QVR4_CALRO|nr:IRP1A [Caligus rogercresseyi]